MLASGVPTRFGLEPANPFSCTCKLDLNLLPVQLWGLLALKWPRTKAASCVNLFLTCWPGLVVELIRAVAKLSGVLTSFTLQSISIGSAGLS